MNDTTRTTSSTTTAPAPAPAAQSSHADVQAEIRSAREHELGRAREIRAIGQQFNRGELAEAAIQAGETVDAFRAAILAAMHTEAQTRAREQSAVGLSATEVRQFSFVRLMHALANPTDPSAQAHARFEREVSDAAIAKSGRRGVRGFLVPTDILRAPNAGLEATPNAQRALAQALRAQGMQGRRDLLVGTAGAGGYTVATDLLAGSFIDLLRNRMALQRLGITTLNDLSGNIAIPRQSAGTTACWVAENNAPTEGQQTVDQVTMSPKTVGAYTDYSRKLLLQSSIDVEAFVRTDITRVLGLELDRVGLYGSGSSNQPTGIKSQSGINTKDFAADTPTFAEVVALETEVATDNADIGSLAYLCNASMRGALKVAPKVSGFPVFIWENDSLNGYRAECSNQSASNDLWFGNWADLVLGLWSGLDIMVDPYTGGTAGTVRIVALQDADICVRHPESFCRGNNTL